MVINLKQQKLIQTFIILNKFKTNLTKLIKKEDERKIKNVKIPVCCCCFFLYLVNLLLQDWMSGFHKATSQGQFRKFTANFRELIVTSQGLDNIKMNYAFRGIRTLVCTHTISRLHQLSQQSFVIYTHVIFFCNVSWVGLVFNYNTEYLNWLRSGFV